MEKNITEKSLSFKVHTTYLLEEIINSTTEGHALKIPLIIFRDLLKQVARRASQLNDPKMNSLMCRLALYAIADPNDKEFDQELTNKIINDGSN